MREIRAAFLRILRTLSPTEKRGAMRAGICSFEPVAVPYHNWSWGTISVTHQFHKDRARGVSPQALSISFLFFVFSSPRLAESSEVRMPFSISRPPVFNPTAQLSCTHPSHFAAVLLPFCCVEHSRMHSQQLTRNPPDSASFDILPSSFYPGFLEPGNSKVTQAPHHPPPYVQRPFVPDSGASLEGGGSPPPLYHIHEPQQGHSRISPSSSPQHYPLQLPVPVAYPLQLQHDNERHNSTHQGLSHQLHRLPQHTTYMTCVNGAFPNNASPQPMPPRGIPPVYGQTFPLRQGSMYPLTPAHHPAPTHSSPEQSQHTMTQGPPTLLEQHEDRVLPDHGQRRWGGAGSLDPTTGVFSRASDHPRIRTAQACEKCRARKAKVSISFPSRSLPYSVSFIF